MNDLRRVNAALSQELEHALVAVMRSGYYLNGPYYRRFCQTYAASLGTTHCFGVGNGTDALELAVRALQSRYVRDSEKDASNRSASPEVITVANAGGYTTTACHLTGCVPVYVDIEPHSQLLSIPAAVASLSEHTLAVVATHLYGGFLDVPELRRKIDEAGYQHVPILEDCAQAHGLVGDSGVAGVCGSIAAFSFYPTKNLGALGDAGAIVTSDEFLAAAVGRLHQYGWEGKYEVASPFGRNSRMDELQAAFLELKLAHLEVANTRRCKVIDEYQGALPNGVRLVRSEHGTVAHLAVLMTEERDRLRRHLGSLGISTDVHYPVLDPDQRGWHGLPKRIGPSGLGVSRYCVERILTIPCFPTMAEEEIDAVCSALASYTA